MMDPSDPVQRLRGALVAPPDAETAHRHLEAMRRAALVLPSGAKRSLARALLLAASVIAIAASLPLAVPREALPGGIVRSTTTAATELLERASEPDIGSAEVGTEGAGTQGEQPGTVSQEDANEHGERVSETARTTEKEGREKGKEVSEAASSKSQEHRKDGEKRPEENPAGITPGAGEKAGGKPDEPPAGSRGKGKGKG